jgi:GDP-L-fucose synthase
MTETPKEIFSLAGKAVFVAGHKGMVGSAVVRRLGSERCKIFTAARANMDLRDQTSVNAWMADAQPDVIVLAAATVGGIMANNTRPGEFLYDNLMITGNVIEAARQNKVAKLLYLGSSCIYPRLAEQPIRESALLSGPLEPTNEWYAIAKIAGLKMCTAYRRQYGCDFISAMPTNLYGPGDNYDLNSSHVLPALLRKAHEAKISGAGAIQIWGTGTPRREFMHVDDLSDALVFLLKHYSAEDHVNAGSGEEVSIADLARAVCAATGFEGALQFDASKPDGAPRKLMDSTRLRAMGWRPRISLKEGLAAIYADLVRTGEFSTTRL